MRLNLQWRTITGNTTKIVASSLEKSEAKLEKIVENLSLKLENEKLQCRLREAKLEQQSKDNENFVTKIRQRKASLGRSDQGFEARIGRKIQQETQRSRQSKVGRFRKKKLCPLLNFN